MATSLIGCGGQGFDAANTMSLGSSNISKVGIEEEIVVTDISASDTYGGNSPAKALDSNMNSRWVSRVNGATIEFEFAELYQVTRIEIR